MGVDTRHLPLYWFPRDCPRGTFWATLDTTGEDAEIGGYWFSRQTIRPTERVELGDLVVRHAEAGIEPRVVDNLWPAWNRVVASSLECSGIRLHNALPPPT